MGAGAAKAFKGAAGSGTGSGTVSPMQPTRGTSPLGNLAGLAPLSKLAPLNPDKGTALRTGQASIPVGQSPMNPWGKDRGGSGKLPLYRRPGTLPGT
jgi:hypothetical protein